MSAAGALQLSCKRQENLLDICHAMGKALHVALHFMLGMTRMA